jgi:hypothetical protein
MIHLEAMKRVCLFPILSQLFENYLSQDIREQNPIQLKFNLIKPDIPDRK